jgi:hypothetical protein
VSTVQQLDRLRRRRVTRLLRRAREQRLARSNDGDATFPAHGQQLAHGILTHRTCARE